MNSLKRVCLMWLCALAVQVTAWAQQVQVSPVPQSVNWGEKAFASAGAKFAIKKQLQQMLMLWPCCKKNSHRPMMALA